MILKRLLMSVVSGGFHVETEYKVIRKKAETQLVQYIVFHHFHCSLTV
jgi:hypothetical protein